MEPQALYLQLKPLSESLSPVAFCKVLLEHRGVQHFDVLCACFRDLILDVKDRFFRLRRQYPEVKAELSPYFISLWKHVDEHPESSAFFPVSPASDGPTLLIDAARRDEPAGSSAREPDPPEAHAKSA
ncbi:MAG: hypothetical protein HY719_11090 [Planctomycetes bacterium]|nr:hypothetical protein [Planctomycetota bacterium]